MNAQGTYKLIPRGQQGTDPGEIVEIIGQAAFSGTDTTVEVNVGPLSEIVGAQFTVGTVTINANDAPLGTDGTITSGAITVARAASGTSGLTFYYRIQGRT
jgi:hypothetical protein